MKTWLRARIRSRKQPEQQYTYQALNQSKHEIRVLHLLPGRWNASIEIRLSTRPLDDKTLPTPYEALSYTWGDANDTRSIFVVTKGGPRRLSVTRNCELALRYLRDRFPASGPLWVDAICINQGDMAERSSQVRFMVEIYSRAQQVTVWLGEADGSTSLAMDGINAASTKLSSPSSFEPRHVLSGLEFRAVLHLVNQPWFTRLWIWQEIWTGGDKSVILWGRKQTRWHDLRVVLPFIFEHLNEFLIASPELYENERLALPADHIARLVLKESPGDTLHQLLRMQLCHCSDARDRIFTAQNLAIMYGHQPYWTPPDYSRTLTEIYTQFSVKYLSCTQRLSFLNHLTVPVQQGLPSWAPDWSSTSPIRTLYTVCACGPSKSNASVVNDNELKVTGVIIDYIEDTACWDQALFKAVFQDGDANGGFAAMASFRDAIRTSKLFLLDDRDATSLHEHDVVISNLCKVLFSGLRTNPSEQYADQPVYNRREQIRAMKQLLSSTNLNDVDNRAAMVLGSLLGWCDGRCLARTRCGSLLLGPARTQRGDLVTVFLGCEMAIVLRSAHLSRHSVIGSAYIDGFMDGESLLGPLPNHFAPATLMRGRNGTDEYIFKHDGTGDAHREDPRLASLSLPRDWVLEKHTDAPLEPTFRNEVTGEVRSWNQDPRCDAHELEKRGVRLQTFDLV